jgi:hypothetical protein
MDVFLDSPQDFGNLCLLSRTLEVLGVKRCYVHDPHRLIRQRYGKSRTRKIKTVSAGAFFRVAFKRVEAPEVFLAALPGRKVATVPDQHATSFSASRSAQTRSSCSDRRVEASDRKCWRCATSE